MDCQDYITEPAERKKGQHQFEVYKGFDFFTQIVICLTREGCAITLHHIPEEAWNPPKRAKREEASQAPTLVEADDAWAKKLVPGEAPDDCKATK